MVSNKNMAAAAPSKRSLVYSCVWRAEGALRASASVGPKSAVLTIKVAEALRIHANGVHQDALHMLAPVRGAFTCPTLEGSTRGSADGTSRMVADVYFQSSSCGSPGLAWLLAKTWPRPQRANGFWSIHVLDRQRGSCERKCRA